MLTPRNAIATAIVVAILGVLISVFNLTRAPDNHGAGVDSYGIRSDGYRAFYETLEQLGVPIERSFIPPFGHLGRAVTLALVAPDPDRLKNEPEYMRDIGQWIAGSGQAVLALYQDAQGSGCGCETDAAFADSPTTATVDDGPTTSSFPLDLLDLADMDGLSLITWPPAKDAPPPAVRKPAETTNADRWVRRTHVDQGRIVPVAGEGELSELGETLKSLSVPEVSLRLIDPQAMGGPVGWLSVTDDAGTSGVLAAVYEIGRGRMILLSDARVLQNGLLGQASNAVLGTHLLAWGGRPIVMDDFYHGLSVRGNPLWLLTRLPYALLALALVGWTGLLAWGAAIQLGPALPDRLIERRSMSEYLEAMATLFSGRSSRRHVLERLRGGGLWWLRLRLNLPPGRESLEAITGVLERRDAGQAEALQRSVQALDRLIQTPGSVGPAEMCQAAEAFNQCVKKEKA